MTIARHWSAGAQELLCGPLPRRGQASEELGGPGMTIGQEGKKWYWAREEGRPGCLVGKEEWNASVWVH
jgi:hypothetical protein